MQCKTLSVVSAVVCLCLPVALSQDRIHPSYFGRPGNPHHDRADKYDFPMYGGPAAASAVPPPPPPGPVPFPLHYPGPPPAVAGGQIAAWVGPPSEESEFEIFKYEFEMAKKAVFSVIAPIAVLALLKPKILGLIKGSGGNIGAGFAGAIPLGGLSATAGRRRRSHNLIGAWTDPEGLLNRRLQTLDIEKYYTELNNKTSWKTENAKIPHSNYSVGLEKHHCIERLVCELYYQRRSELGSAIMYSVISNRSLPLKLKGSVKKARRIGKLRQNCSPYGCQVVNQVFRTLSVNLFGVFDALETQKDNLRFSLLE